MHLIGTHDGSHDAVSGACHSVWHDHGGMMVGGGHEHLWLSRAKIILKFAVTPVRRQGSALAGLLATAGTTTVRPTTARSANRGPKKTNLVW